MAQFNGFDGRPIPKPPPWIFDDEAYFYNEQFDGIDIRVEDYFHDLGVSQANEVVTQWIEDVKSRSASGTAELGAEIRRYDVADSMEQAAYLRGFCGALAERAETFRWTVELMAEDGLTRVNRHSVSTLFGHFAEMSEGDFVQLVDGDPGVTYGDAESIHEALQASAGVSPSDVLALANRIEVLARGMSAHARIPLPNALAQADEFAERQQRDANDRVALTRLIDTYSAVRAVPLLTNPDPESHATRREQLAAEIAAAHTRQPHLLAGLPQDRIQTVQLLLPDDNAAHNPPAPGTTTVATEQGKEPPMTTPSHAEFTGFDGLNVSEAPPEYVAAVRGTVMEHFRLEGARHANELTRELTNGLVGGFELRDFSSAISAFTADTQKEKEYAFGLCAQLAENGDRMRGIVAMRDLELPPDYNNFMLAASELSREMCLEVASILDVASSTLSDRAGIDLPWRLRKDRSADALSDAQASAQVRVSAVPASVPTVYGSAFDGVLRPRPRPDAPGAGAGAGAAQPTAPPSTERPGTAATRHGAAGFPPHQGRAR